MKMSTIYIIRVLLLLPLKLDALVEGRLVLGTLGQEVEITNKLIHNHCGTVCESDDATVAW